MSDDSSMTPDRPDELYVGYRPQAPPATARFVRWIVIGLMAGGVGLAALLAPSQKPFDLGVFEFGQVRSFRGIAEAQPYPALRLDPGDDLPAGVAGGAVSLVAPGKHGADAMVEPFVGREVEVEGTLIYRPEGAMIEVVPGSMRPAGNGTPTQPDTATEDLGPRTLRGEIVDSKCYLGVMKPGRRKTHRACAALCIRGGIPPLFLVENAAGEQEHLFLVDASGGPVNDRVLDLVAEPIEITGRILRQGDRLLLAASPETYRRVASLD